ncbi:MAG TPA: arylesterase [Bryobacterales bacterium]|nr:arylesterase [Bryobacterales bacterium]
MRSRKAFSSACGALVIYILLAGCSRAPETAQQEHEPGPSAAAEHPAQAAPDPRPVIVAFGDSLTAGQGLDPELSYPAVLERELAAKGHSYRVINAGVSGDTTGGGLARVDAVLALQPRIVILELGANDGLRGLPVETTRANLEQIIVALRRGGAKVVLAGMTLPPNYGPDYIHSFERVFVDLASKYGLPHIPFLLADVATRRDRMQGDGLHPNAAGQRVVAANVMRVLEPLLRENGVADGRR